MAAEFNRADTTSRKCSSLEADDGCHFYPATTGGGPYLAKQNLFVGRGMDVCDHACDSGVSMTSFGCEVIPSLGSSDLLKPQLADQHTPDTLVSVGYTSFSRPEDVFVDSALECKLEGLDISCSEAVTTTTSTIPCPVIQQEDPRRAFVDKLKLYFTPDDDGDTYVYYSILEHSRNVFGHESVFLTV